MLTSNSGVTAAQLVLRDIGIIAVVAAASVWLAWIGYQGWGLDDWHYLLAAERWANAPPHVGETHWELRLGFVLPLAASLGWLGYSEAALVAVPVVFYAALVLVNYGFVASLIGRIQGLFAGIVTATVPVIAAWATTPRVAIAEALYLSVAFWCFATVGLTRQRGHAWLLISGVCVGLAWLSRESAIGFALAFLLLFFIGRPVRRKKYIWLLTGAALVVVAELGFYWSTTGNPFYRLYIDLHHGVITSSAGQAPDAKAVVARARGEAGVAARDASYAGQQDMAVRGPAAADADLGSAENAATAAPGAPVELRLWGKLERLGQALAQHFDPKKLSGEGTVAPVSVSRLAEPYVLFLIEPYYGLVVWLLVPAAAYLLAVRAPPRTKLLVILLLAFAACSIVASLYLIYLRPLPRYFLFVAGAAGVIVGLALGTLWLRRRRRIAVAILVAFAISSAVFMEARRGLGLYNERRLVDFAASTEKPIYTDDATIRMSELFVRSGRFRGALSGCPTPASILFFNSMRSADEEALAAVAVGAILGSTELVYVHQGNEKILGRILRTVGLSRMLPDYTVERLAYPYGVAGAFDLGWLELCELVEPK